MVRCMIRLALLVAVACAGAVFVIRAHPYDDRALRTLLLSDECRSPCFLGIRPGVTRLTDALVLLRASHWVQTETIAYSEADHGGGVIWLWNRSAAPFLGRRISSLISLGRQGEQVVDMLHISTAIPIGDIYLTLGDTPYTGTGDTGVKDEGYVALFYLEQGISIWSNIDCPTLNHSLWREPVVVQYRHDLKRIGHFNEIGSFC